MCTYLVYFQGLLNVIPVFFSIDRRLLVHQVGVVIHYVSTVGLVGIWTLLYLVALHEHGFVVAGVAQAVPSPVVAEGGQCPYWWGWGHGGDLCGLITVTLIGVL